MRIAISGAVGSGKSTVSKMLAEKLCYEHYSIGNFMREIAQKREMSLMELSKLAEIDSTIDEELDARQKELANEDDYVIDSRLGFHFIRNSFKIFLTVELREAAERILKDKRREETYKDIKDAMHALKRRMQSENIRFKEYYGIDFPKKEHFDLVLDTTKKSPEIVVEEIMEEMKNSPTHKD